MEKEFVSFDQALALKKLKFDEDCFAGYDTFGDLWIGYNSTDGIEYNPSYYNKAPLKQQVFRWFREKYDYDITIGHINNKYLGSIRANKTGYYLSATNEYSTYEEAEIECINKLIELTKQQDK